MKKEQAEQYLLKLDKLRNFFDGRDGFSQNEIIDWIADCTAIFTDIGVSESVISKFLEFFSIKNKKIEFENNDYVVYGTGRERKEHLTIQTIGCFEQEINDSRAFGHLSATERYVMKDGLYYAKVAYSTANSILKRKTDEERLVPSWLINIFTDKEQYASLHSYLELIESNYQDQDAHGIITNSMSLLDSVLQTDPDLKAKKDLGGRLHCLIDNQQCREKFGISRDLVIGLNNARIIRNEKNIHQNNLPIQYNIPFQIAVTFAYLTIYFLEVVMAGGKVVN